MIVNVGIQSLPDSRAWEPALVCNHSDKISITPQVASSVQRTVWVAKPPIRTIETPVYELGA